MVGWISSIKSYDKSLPKNHITDPSEEGKKHNHINNVEASSSKFIK